MASKLKTVYICSSCGNESPKWYGKCPECGEWNTYQEEYRDTAKPAAKTSAALGSSALPLEIARLSEIQASDEERYDTGMSELNRVLGGGIVKGSVVLLGGDPGIGKSTLLLQICHCLCQSLSVLYISGEESRYQLKLRAKRLGVESERLLVASCTDMERVEQAIATARPDIVMVDSIQTMTVSSLSSSAGSVTQVRECTQLLTRIAKEVGVPIFIVGHVNKDGAIAGPKVLEHIVDAVLYFEGDRNSSYRILRGAKNRFGSTNEIGVFQMGEKGLEEVPNPSQTLLAERPKGASGTCVACVMEGSRPILAEVQALVSKTSFGTPRRTSTGFDGNRTALLIAVLEKRAGYFFGSLDSYINIVGGLRLDEPAADLPVAIALLSSLTDTPLDEGLMSFGEVGLAGELRSVSQAELRVAEASRLGFTKCILPAHCMHQIRHAQSYPIQLCPVKTIGEAFKVLRSPSPSQQE